MNPSESKSTQWGVVVAIGVTLVVAYPLRYVLLPFVAAAAIAYLARPLMHWLQGRLCLPRWAAALTAFVLFLCVSGLAAYGVERLAVPQVTQMLTDSRAMIEKFLVSIFHGHQIQLPGGRQLTAKQLADKLNRGLEGIGDDTQQILQFTAAGIAIFMGLVMTFVLLAFFLFTGPRLARGTLWLVPPHLRQQAIELARDVDHMLARYLVGVFIIVLFTSVVTGIVAGPVFHVSHAIFLGCAVGLLELLPVVGPVLSFILFGLVAVQQTGYVAIVTFGVFAIALRLAIDQLVGPIVLGKAARIPAVVVMFSFLVGGFVYGILGVVLAIPVAATIKIVLAHFYETPSAAS